MSKPTVLVVDDEPCIREVLSAILGRAGYEVRSAGSGADAVSAFEKNPSDVCLIDIKMPGMDGIQVLSKIKEINPEVVCLIMTAHDTWETAVEAMRLGAFSYVRKPFDNEMLRASIARALEQKYLSAESSEQTNAFVRAIIGSTPQMEKIFELIRASASTDITVLIEGESGTGKELVAHALHYGSTRAKGNFIAVNCAAFPETLLESEFFGYAKGAFTGADKDKKGLLDVAHDGTLFIDEIGEMPPAMQVKFLRVLEEGEFLPLGSTSVKRVNARIIASTNKTLEREIESGAFRKDLFYRLNVMPIRLPSLRDRRDDIPLLTGHFIAKHSARMDKEVTGVRPEVMSILMSYDWPGNVRELENVIEGSIALAAEKEISVKDITRVGGGSGRGSVAQGIEVDVELPVDLSRKMEETEIRYIEEALQRTEGNLTKAAQLLGLSFRSLRYRVKKLGVGKE